MVFRLLCIVLLICCATAATAQPLRLTVGMEQNPPICFVDQSGTAQGITVDLLNEVARREGWQISYVRCAWKECLQQLENRQLDLLLGIGQTPEREQLYDFIKETAVINWAQIYAHRGVKVSSPLDLAGKRVALVPKDLHGAAFLDQTRRFGIDSQIISVASYGEAVKAVELKQADACVVSRLFPISKEQGKLVEQTPVIFHPVQNKIAAPKGMHKQILELIDHHLTVMKADRGSGYCRIIDRWLGVPIRSAVPAWAVWALVGAAALLLFLGGANLLCTLRIRHRTRQLVTEIGQHQATSDTLRHREEQLRTIIATTGEGYLLLSPDASRVLEVNEALCRLLEYRSEELLGQHPGRFFSTAANEIFTGRIALSAAGSQSRHDLDLIRSDGEVITVQCNVTRLPETPPQGSTIFAFMTDISERLRYEEQLLHQAHHDPLTGLPNRLLLHDRVQQTIAAGQRSDSFLVVILLDLDNFKVVNDTLGHAVGDTLLQHFARRISSLLRQGDTFARLGGDEFVILPGGIESNQDILQLIARIFDALTRPFEFHDYELFVTTSIGIARYPDDGVGFDTLLKHADAAMYQAKRDGKQDFRFFTRELDSKMHSRLSLESRLRRALERDEFELHYQPQVEMRTGRITGAEALLRWRQKDGLIPPAEFIPVLEDTGLILPVGAWVLETACREAATWQSVGGIQLKLSVNISARQFRQPDLVAQLTDILRHTGLHPRRLVLELTESMLMDSSRETLHKLEQLTALGIDLAIDDFGTGYSSLAYLANLPIRELKIDRSFIGTLPHDKQNTAIVLAVSAMAASLSLNVVVEGVENTEQAQFLQTSGLTIAQGFLYSYPLPPDILQKLLSEKLSDDNAAGTRGALKPGADNHAKE